MHGTNSTTHYPQAMCGALQHFHCLWGPRGAAVHCTISIAHWPQTMWQRNAAFPRPIAHAVWKRIAALPMLTGPRQCGGALQKLPAHCPRAVWPCIAAVPLHIANAPCGGALHDFHYSLPTGGVPAECSNSTAYRPHTVWAHCLLQRDLPRSATNSLVAGEQWNSCHAPLHGVGPIGSGSAAMQCSTAWRQ